MATATCKLMYNITIHMTGYGVRILLTMIGQTETSWVASKVAFTRLHSSNSPAPHSGQ